MNLEPIIFFDLIAAVLILSVAIIVIIGYISSLIKKIEPYQKEQEKLEHSTTKESADIVLDAKNKAVKIIDEANNKSLDIIQKTNLLTNNFKDNFDEQIKNIANSKIKVFENAAFEFTSLYEQVLKDLRSKNIEVFQNISKDIEKSTMEEVKNFKTAIEKQTTESENLIKKKIQEEYELARKDIENYKQNEKNKVDDKIYQLLSKVSELVLGKSLNLSEHEELIIQAFEKAKKEGTFDK